MSIAGYIPSCLTEVALKELVVAAIDGAPESDPETFHASFDHLERSISLDDVIHGLEGDWNFDRPPVFNKDEWQWKYFIATESIDGDEILVIIAVDTLNRSFEVVTRWRE